ncbi:chemotaxis protein CheA [Parathalassolituus penaei]|uniref:Chemotaxis protein CheA n=1 Tax=Parathalassolituus penaei TaxID=2997323 RepID=A0A9X3EF28_9GAMM|nr:chemotaxis protein CheA [Parathalassolituus penaei]MCY0966045.1 chemotaxis protein CheA [Parathalassolituus penaei]
MSIDLSQFHQVFFEESFEGLDVMESELLALSPESVDAETVNTIFRAAHSIKGGAGTFGFMQVSEFTHQLETLLDEIRAGQRTLEKSHVDLFLQSVDCLRAMLTSLKDHEAPDMSRAEELKKQFIAILKGEVASSPANEADAPAPETAADAGPEGWVVRFIPSTDLLQTGNEPFRMFRELQSLLEDGSQLQIEVDSSRLPEFENLQPEQCYLSWTLTVTGAINKADIETVFEWVVDECDITYRRLGEAASADNASTDNAGANNASDSSSESESSSDAANIATDTNNVTVASVAEAPAPVQAQITSIPVADATQAPAPKPAKSADQSSIRVSIDKVDSLINMVGELVITQSMLGQLGQDFDMSRLARLQEGLSQLEQNTRELQESVMKIRMMPISFAFSRFPRLVRDLGAQLGKKVNLVMQGENTELDKTVMEKIGDPLVHLVRNSLDHGLETTEKRIASGKNETGTITLNAFHQGGNIVIEVRDDGAGLNEEKILQKARDRGLVAQHQELSSEEIHQLIFLPGFSTADVVSDISGRGVGMDVVRRNISELNGTIEVKSNRGTGSTFVIRLPLTLAILDGQLVRVRDQTYIFPLVSIVESIQLQKQTLNNITGSQPVMKLREEYIPIVRLDQIFHLRHRNESVDDAMLVVVEGDNEKIGIVVDDLLGQQQVVIKSLEANYQKVSGVSGATILGDGTVALIIDISGIGKKIEHRGAQPGKEQAA